MKSDKTFEKEQFMIVCRSYFPDCKFENGTNIFMSEVEYAPEMHAWASLYLNQPSDKPGKPVWLEEPVYKLAYEIDERSYATRENEVFFMDLKAFSNALKKLKKG